MQEFHIHVDAASISNEFEEFLLEDYNGPHKLDQGIR